MLGFALGDYRCSYLSVGSFDMDAATLFTDAPANDLGEALERHGLDSDRLVFEVRALLVDSGANRVLIDPAGTWDDPQRLAAVLEQAGIEPASVDTVIVSHGHADHFWGGVDAGGQALFENARYWMQRREWEHWLSSDNPEPDHAKTFREVLLPIEDRFTLIDGEVEIVPGICALPTPGHSPGHMVVRIGEVAIYSGDVLLSPVNVEHPGWTSHFDLWPEQVVASRRKLLERLEQDGSLVLTCHFPGSGAGKVVTEGEGRRWLPESLPGA
jgi:glyoxylase-like metal-dependent hydrolase (beta-lactamase superfamily II)